MDQETVDGGADLDVEGGVGGVFHDRGGGRGRSAGVAGGQQGG